MTKVLCLSDTHGKEKAFITQIQDLQCDMLLHAGDITSMGYRQEVIQFLDWYSSFNHIDFKGFLGGNHDWFLQESPEEFEETLKDYPTLTYLHHRSVEVEGFKLWGSNYSPFFNDWAFNVRRGEPARALWDLIPEDTNILVVHGPMYGVLDYVEHTKEHVGCKDLRDRIGQLPDLQLFISGHIHGSYSPTPTVLKSGIQVVNASLLNEQYRPVNKPILVEL